MDNKKRAKVLIQAMPYIKKWSGETIVVKYGGNAMINDDLKSAVMSDLVLMQLIGINVVLVHGGGPEINAMLNAIGKESRFEGGMRVTDKETIDIVQMVLAKATAAGRSVCADSTASCSWRTRWSRARSIWALLAKSARSIPSRSKTP